MVEADPTVVRSRARSNRKSNPTCQIVEAVERQASASARRRTWITRAERAKLVRLPRSGDGFIGLSSGLPGLRLPLLYSNRPSLMIAPASGKLQVSRRESLEPKPTPLNELARCFVVGLNIRLEPM